MKLSNIILGESDSTKKLLRQIRKACEGNKDVLLVGERGVGKSTIAYAIHAITKGSHPKGFLMMGSVSATNGELRKLVSGEIRVPKGGTVLIEEIEALGFLSQLQILKFLDERKSRMRTRAVFTMTEKLESLVHRGKVSPALAERLKEFYTVDVLPLRERPEDVPDLVSHFLKRACQDLEIRPKALDTNTLEFLMNRDWKENIRELKAVVEKAVLTSQGEMLALPEEVLDEVGQVQGILANLSDRRRFSLDTVLENLERTIIQRTLEKFEYNQTRVAEMLGVTEANLRYRLKKFAILSSRSRL